MIVGGFNHLSHTVHLR